MTSPEENHRGENQPPPTSSSVTGRPPKPVPFGYEYASASSATLKNSQHQRSDSITDSRRCLQRDIHRRRHSLSCREIAFLDQLCVHGNETQVTIARERLLDEALFPEYHEHETTSRDVSGGLLLSEPFINDASQYGREQSANVTSEEEPAIPAVVAIVDGEISGSQYASLSSLGSERRQLLLQIRRQSAVFPCIWKSHRSGLSLSTGASRRNLLERQSSSSLGRFQANAIFRSSRSSSSMTRLKSLKATAKDNQSETRLQIRQSAFRRSQTMSTLVLEGGRRASLTGRPKPGLRRQQSDFSQKSVTFGDLPERNEDMDGSFRSFMKRTSRPFADSISSIPSLHKAHRVGSVGSMSMRSISSIPSLHLARHVYSRSQSFRSSDSLGGNDWDTNQEFVDFGRSGEEKKVDDYVPNDVDIGESVDIKELGPLSKVSNVDLSRPVLVSDAQNTEDEGVEVADFEIFALNDKEHGHHGSLSIDSARRLKSLVSFGGGSDSVVTSASFDETMSHGRISSIFRRSNLTRTLSDDDLSGIYLGGSRLYRHESSSVKEVQPVDDDVSWIGSDIDEFDYYDAWNVIKDEYANGYGGGGTLSFAILGTFAEDVDSQPHVLSPPLMESLQEFLPVGLTGQNFWMKYSLVRDGASMVALLKAARGTKYSILAIETVDGEVFGCFTSQAWRKNWNYYGGVESFLWRMQHTRKEKTRSIIDQAQMESEIEVFPLTGANDHIQLCTHDKIAVGGRSDKDKKAGDQVQSSQSDIKDHEWGFGLTIEKDCLTGTSSPCTTFSSPSLSHEHPDGSLFEIMNMELWTLTPCLTVDDAERLELSKLFLEEHTPR